MIALFKTAADAHAAMAAIRIKVAELGLQLNSKSGVGWIADGVDWVGYRHWPNYKIIRRRALKRLRRKVSGGCSLETAVAYLSHAKNTASIACVANTFWRHAPEHRCKIHAWVKEHAPAIYPRLPL